VAAFDELKRPADCGFLAGSCIASPLLRQRFRLGYEVFRAGYRVLLLPVALL
jgi:hypothetical protein